MDLRSNNIYFLFLEYIVDCQWSEWQTVLYTNHNGTTCGQLNCTRNGMSPQVSNGLKNRTRIIPASLHGRDCEGGETEQCTANCPGIKTSPLKIFTVSMQYLVHMRLGSIFN